MWSFPWDPPCRLLARTRQRRLTRPPLRRRPDHDANRVMLEAVLRRRGYTTLHAPDGSAAVTLAEERRFDLILMVRAERGLIGVLEIT